MDRHSLTPEADARIAAAGRPRDVPARPDYTTLKADMEGYEFRLRIAEFAARKAPRSGLPLTVPSLRHVAETNWPQYEQLEDGSFQLYYVFASDQTTWDALGATPAGTRAMAEKRILRIPDGTTPEELAAEIATRDAVATQVVKEVDDHDEAIRKEKLAKDLADAERKLHADLAATKKALAAQHGVQLPSDIPADVKALAGIQ